MIFSVRSIIYIFQVTYTYINDKFCFDKHLHNSSYRNLIFLTNKCIFDYIYILI